MVILLDEEGDVVEMVLWCLAVLDGGWRRSADLGEEDEGVR